MTDDGFLEWQIARIYDGCLWAHDRATAKRVYDDINASQAEQAARHASQLTREQQIKAMIAKRLAARMGNVGYCTTAILPIPSGPRRR